MPPWTSTRRRLGASTITLAGLFGLASGAPAPAAMALGATLGTVVGASLKTGARHADRRHMAADTAAEFHWAGHIEATRWVRIRNLSGSIRVQRAPGADVDIRGRKSWGRGDPDKVHITLQRTGAGDGDVLVCALWDERTTCDDDSYSSHSHHRGGSRDDDVSVDFTVSLPAGLKVLASTVNGDVEIGGATSEVDASSVNGGVDASTQGGPVRAASVNGDVRAQMQQMPAASRLDYSSVNGSVTVTLPADLKADVDLETVNGSVRSDFPIAVTGTVAPQRLHGTIAGGGPRLHVETVNGSVELRKGGGQ